ncbi:ATP-dependent helicase [Geitlerinema sp. PCC 9228]|uniref:ATP-dependent helicase n=1 Tax=Geitlerinema sp. PCC 9228 TaxID=111611 RepID=UPI001FCD3E27|nr:ATP-dependent helicase [Geitlerinema sp. PCC 9228]
MAAWQGDPLAVSAVPGSGKSTGMAAAAALAIARYRLHPRRQLAVVTYTRSAATSISYKIRQRLQKLGLPQNGYFVNTLHGLAFRIASRHPELSGVNFNDSTTVSPQQSHRFVRHCVERWIESHPLAYQKLLFGQEFDGEETERLRRQSVLRTEVLPKLVRDSIHEAKSSGMLPEDLQAVAEANRHDEYGILEIAASCYQTYQELLRSRDFIDYDDMVLAALRVLQAPDIRQLWQSQIFAVFEDESQDSYPLQVQLLDILARDSETPDTPPKIIRIGDPNQAINATFTSADPIYFRQFCQECAAKGQLATMDQAGRSTHIVMDAANALLEWANQQAWQQQQDAFYLPFRQQKIRPVDGEDPQPDANPPATGCGLEIYEPPSIDRTVELIGRRVKELLQENSQRSAAVLVRENKQGNWLANVLQNPESYGLEPDIFDKNISIYEVARRDRQAAVPTEMLALLRFLYRPHSPDYIKSALEVLQQRHLIYVQDLNPLASLPEQFLFPTTIDRFPNESVAAASQLCQHLLEARFSLPTTNLIPFLAMELQYNADELATADKLGDRIAQQTGNNQSLAATIDILTEIVNAERFQPVETETDESQYTQAGQLTIITMHKAKGLDWDYVFLPFLHHRTIPGSLWQPQQSKFLGEYNLADVARSQIRTYLRDRSCFLTPKQAWEQAERLKQAEEYRLLYVAMTRAKRLLWMSAAKQAPFSWNQPENLSEQPPSDALIALRRQFPASICS